MLTRVRPLLLGLALIACSPAVAQDDPTSGAEGPTEAGGDAPADVLSPTEVAAAAQQVTATLYRMRARIHHVRDLEHHLVVIQALGRKVARLRGGSDLGALETQPRRELHNLRERWAELHARLTETAEALETSAAALEVDAAEVRGLQERWGSTAEVARDQAYPDSARLSIDEVLALVGEVAAELREYLERVLAAQTELARHAIMTGDVLAQLDRAIEANEDRVLSRTHPPGLGGMTGRAHSSLGQQLADAAQHHVHALDRFVVRLHKHAYSHAMLTLALLALLYWLRRESRVEDPDGPAARSLGHPVAVTIFAALLLVRPLYPLAPRAVLELCQLLAIGSLLIMDATPRERRVTRLVVFLYAIDWLRLLLDEQEAEHRVALVATGILATCGLAWCARGADGPARPAWGAASVGTALGVAACLAGYVPVAALLVEGVIASAFVGVALMALHRASVGWVDAGLTTAFAARTVLGRHAEVTRQAAYRALKVFFALSWAWVALDYFRLRGVVTNRATRALRESVHFGEMEISLGDALAFVSGIWVAVLLSRVLARTLQEDVAPRLGVGPGVPAAAALVVRYAVLALGFVLAASAAGIGLAQLSLFAGALGVGAGFGLQNIVSNFVSGLLLVFERPVKVGDTVDVAGFRGTIIEIGIRASTVRAVSGADIIIPNSKLIEGELINWTHQDPTIRVDFPVGVAYGSDVQRVHEILLAAAQALPIALATPAPSVLMTGFGDSSIDFEVRIWIDEAKEHPVARSVLGLAIHEALAAAEIEIPFPQRDVHMRTVD